MVEEWWGGGVMAGKGGGGEMIRGISPYRYLNL
jgi:hypothetical protein